MNTYIITWFWPEEFEVLENDTQNADNTEYMRQYLKRKARGLFDCNPGIESLKASVVDFDNNVSYIIEFEKKPAGEYEILITEY